MQQPKIVFIGAGNVATHIGRLFNKHNYKIVQIFSRTKISAAKLAKTFLCSYTTDPKHINKNADIYILAIPDDSIARQLSSLKFPKNKIIIHTSGSIPMKILKNITRNYGVFYPIQTLSKKDKSLKKNIPIAIEASNEKTKVELLKLGSTISNNIYLLNSEERKAVHIAAVFTNNFTNYMYSIAEDILQQKEIPFDLLKPLAEETSKKIKKYSPSQVQTGPAIRSDNKVIKEHLKMLTVFPRYKKIYKLLSESIKISSKQLK